MLCMAAFPAWASIEVTSIEIYSNSKQDKVVLTFSAPPDYTLFTLNNPDRVVIDVMHSRLMGQVSLPGNYSGKTLQNIRSGKFDGTRTRIVFDLTQPVDLSQAKLSPADGSYKLTFTLSTSGNVPAAANELPTKAPSEQPFANPHSRDQAPEKQEPVKQEIAKQEEEPLSHNELPTKSNRDTSKKPVIVIDAGHGGDDPGAIGVGGVQEKDITLSYAFALRDALLKSGKYRVIMTRSNDRFILLRERVAIARRAGGEIFISLHADSAPEGSTRGLSVYTLSETASDAEAEALAQRENKADLIAGVDLSNQSKDVTEILIDLVQRETMNKSQEFAQGVVGEVGQKVTLLPNTHRYAGFAVLKAPDIPSILIELGFLSNGRDTKLLLSEKYKKGVVSGIAKGVGRFFAQH